MDNCPSVDELERMLNVQLSADRAELVKTHVDTCTTCLETLGGLSTIPAAWHEVLAYAHEQTDRELPEDIARIAQSPPVFGLEQGRQRQSDAPDFGQVLTGKILGVYELQSVLGKGGMGTVYKARHTRLKRTVAIKVLPRNRQLDHQWATRFERELEAVGGLDHSHIVRAEHADSEGDIHYLVMEFVDGVNLTEAARTGEQVPVPEACEIASCLADALRYVHQKGLVHRDVKPSNVMLSRRGEVKLLDLGLVFFSERNTSENHLTTAGQIVGTPVFMAPEQVLGEDISGAADVYALGCTLYALLAGEPPFVGDRQAVVRGHLYDRPRELAARRDEVTRPLSDLVMRMLAKEPTERPGLDEVVRQLAPFCAGSDLQRFASTIAAGAFQKPSPAQNVRRKTERRWGWKTFVRAAVSIALAALLIAFAAQMLVIRNRNGQVTASIPFPAGSSAQLVADRNAEDRPIDTPPVAPVAERDVERLVAIETIKAGGTIRLHGWDVDFKRESELPAGKITIRIVSLNSVNSVSDEQIGALQQLSDLQGLDLSNTPVTGKQFQVISGISTLRWLYLGATKTSDIELAHLSKLRQLQTLQLWDTAVTDDGIVRLPDLPLLDDLGLNHVNVGNAALEGLDRFPNLQYLFLNNTRVSDEGLKHLCDTLKLRQLSLEGTSVTDDGLVHLTTLKKLEQLNLKATKTTAEGVALLQAALPNCEIQAGDPERDAAVATLKVGGKVSIWGESGYIADAKYLPDRAFQIDKIDLSNCGQLNDETTALIARASSARMLDLGGSTLSDAGFELVTRVGSLRWLYVEETAVTADGIRRIGTLDQLLSLELSKTGVTDFSLEGLKLPALENLWLDQTAVTDEGIQFLNKFSKLRILDLSQTSVTDRGLEWLVDAVPRLEELRLNETDISDSGLVYLRNLTQLVRLEVRGTQVTGAAINTLRKDLPKCTVTR